MQDVYNITTVAEMKAYIKQKLAGRDGDFHAERSMAFELGLDIGYYSENLSDRLRQLVYDAFQELDNEAGE